jgi:hypothetical protein
MIVAAAGENSSFGLPGMVSRCRVQQPSINIDGQVWLSALQDPKDLTIDSKWASRAWTYQVGLLSVRRLIFTVEKVYFECNTMPCRESANYDLLELID